MEATHVFPEVTGEMSPLIYYFFYNNKDIIMDVWMSHKIKMYTNSINMSLKTNCDMSNFHKNNFINYPIESKILNSLF